MISSSECYSWLFLPAIVVIASIVAAMILMSFIATPPVVLAQQPPATAPRPDFAVTITIDAAATKGRLKPIYRFFGADEPNYAYMKDGMKLLNDIGKLGPSQTFFRAHNLMCTGDGTPALKWGSTNMYTEDAQGNPVYDWAIIDRIFESYMKNGVKPYAQIGFMPKVMSIHPEPYQHTWEPGQPYGNIYTGWSYPPKDYEKWRELVYQWTKHCVEKWGKEEVEKWYWEVWNESNAGNPRTGAYWRGTPEEFHKLHDYAIDGVRKALPTAKVGGPDTAGHGGQWMRDFLDHCLRGTNHATGKVGTPLDFIAFHAKGSPSIDQGHVRMGISNQLRTIDEGFRIIASYPELKNRPIVIGESDPDGCAACAAFHTAYRQNAYRNTELYASYTAAAFARKHELADRHGVNLEGAVTWAFEFENQPIFAGFRVMATNGGISLPVFNVFRMFGKMSGQRVTVSSSGEVPLADITRSGVRGENPDVSAIAAIDGHKLFVFAWHYHDDEIPGPDAAITLSLKNLPTAAQRAQLVHYRVDRDHSNAHTAWKKMSSPHKPTPEQYAQLEKAGQLEMIGDEERVNVRGGSVGIQMKLPRQGVSLLIFTW
jgi:xylan 1,4-beta-xylosidase